MNSGKVIIYGVVLAGWLVLGLSSCDKKKRNNALNEAINWEYYSSKVAFSDPNVQTMLDSLGVDSQCRIEVELLFPGSKQNMERSLHLQNQLRGFLKERLSSLLDEGTMMETSTDDPQAFVDEFVHDQLESFKKEMSEIGEMLPEEEVSPLKRIFVKEYYLKDTLLYNEHGIVSIGMNSYDYSGGAHGISLFTIRSYDLNSNSPITPSTLFQDPTSQGILDAIRDQLLVEYEVDSIAELQEMTGMFSLTNSEVVMSNELYFSKEGITFYYNPYEIAAYVFGASEVTVPYSVLAPFFRSQYQFLGKL